AAGGRALALKVDIRDEDQVRDAAARTAAHFGGIDIVVNNASAIWLAATADVPIKRFDLMYQVNTRGTFVTTQACLPYLEKAVNPHVLMLSPPPNLDPKWFKHHTAYTIAKYGMSLCALGMSAEFAKAGIAVNALWPRTVIATAAIAMLGDKVKPENCRRPEVVADAAHAIVCKPARAFSGNFCIDEDVLREIGVTDLDRYAVKPGAPLLKDLFLD
ncbi:MAG: SDR family oxidoreductase, partial [Rhodanobacteraceae bacterium]